MHARMHAFTHFILCNARIHHKRLTTRLRHCHPITFVKMLARLAFNTNYICIIIYVKCKACSCYLHISCIYELITANIVRRNVTMTT